MRFPPTESELPIHEDLCTLRDSPSIKASHTEIDSSKYTWEDTLSWDEHVTSPSNRVSFTTLNDENNASGPQILADCPTERQPPISRESLIERDD
jgi:hypothetical protein